MKVGSLLANYNVKPLSKFCGNRKNRTIATSHPLSVSWRIPICKAGTEREHEIEKIVKNGSTVVSKGILGRQCFKIKDGKCVLKESHSYYHQIQLQLLVTERTYCDFVLYAADGPVSIETINRDEQLI